jgi:hypothetical protein
VFTRREALRVGAAAVLAGVAGSTVVGSPAAARIAGTRRERVHPLSRSRFAPLVRSTFRLTGPAGRRSVRLSAVRTLAKGAATERSFTLEFTDAGARPLPDGIYGLSHPRLGTVQLFLAPVGGAAGRYEAVVNRLP